MKKLYLIIAVALLLTACTSPPASGELDKVKKDYEQVKTELDKTKTVLKELNFKSVDELVDKYNKNSDDLEQLKVDSEKKEKELQDQINDMTMKLQSQSGQTLICAALDVAELLKNNDYHGLSSQYVDPDKGLTFSPVPFINLTTDKNFTPAEVANLATDTTVYTWTTNLPSGDPLNQTYSNYATNYVNDHDYTEPHLIGNNYIVRTSNMISNIQTVYPSSYFVSLHFTGFDPAVDGLDWTSLRLVFREISGEWKLLNINHAHWTP